VLGQLGSREREDQSREEVGQVGWNCENCKLYLKTQDRKQDFSFTSKEAGAKKSAISTQNGLIILKKSLFTKSQINLQFRISSVESIDIDVGDLISIVLVFTTLIFL